MPSIIIVAGPNGAGKTSFAREFVLHHRERFTYVNADEIQGSLNQGGGEASRLDLKAGRIMLQQIEAAIGRLENVMLETTLATRLYAVKIPGWRRQGYSVGLIYLRLSSVEHSLARVAKRVAAGGHSVPERTIRRRFGKSLEYLDSIYKPLVDEWYVWDSVEGNFLPAEAWDDA
jgi:predicted ABC-type ATPase